MTESDGSALRDIVNFQLTLLDLYETLLDNCEWDEGRINTTLKTFMMSVVALMRIQRTLGERVATVQKEMIGQYRARLEQWLKEYEGGAHGTGDWPWAAAPEADHRSGGGAPR